MLEKEQYSHKQVTGFNTVVRADHLNGRRAELTYKIRNESVQI
jgi:hypothetical protein